MTDLTFVITTRDRPTMLPNAVASAKAQGKVIVVDDGSAVPVEGATIRLGRSVGFVRARMAGLTRVETPYVAFLDDDDWLDSDWYEQSRAGATFGVVAEPCWYHLIHAGQLSDHLAAEDAGWRAEAIAAWRVAA